MTSTSTVPSGRTWQGLALVTLAGVIWGTIGPAVHLAHEASGLSPLMIGGYRSAVAVAVLLLVVTATGRLASTWAAALESWRRVVVVGVLTAVFQALFFVAVLAAGVGVTTVVCLGFAPVLLLVVGAVQHRRGPPAADLLTVATAVLGLLLISLVGGVPDDAPHPTLGLLAALGSGAAYALSADLAGPLSRRLDTLTATAATMTVTAAVLVPSGFVVTGLQGDALATDDLDAWLLIGYLGVVTMAVAYALLFTGLRTTPSGAAVVATLIEPVTAVLIAVLLLDERLSAAGLVGAVLILVAIASLARQHDEPPPQPQ